MSAVPMRELSFMSMAHRPFGELRKILIVWRRILKKLILL